MKKTEVELYQKKFTDVLQVEGIYVKGYGNIPKIVMQDTRLTPEAKCIYSYFCSFAGAGTQAFPSVKLILYHLGISETRYYKHFKLLKDYGYIKSKQSKSKGKYSKTIYTLSIYPSPSISFECTENECTENKGTNNNSINNNNTNNIYNQSIYHTDTILGEGDFETIKQYFRDKLNIESLNITYWKRKNLIQEIELNIIEMYFKDSMVINNKQIPQKLIRAALMKLTYFHIEELIHKFIELSETTKINYPKAYMQSMIYNIAFQCDIAITNVVNFNTHNEGR